MESTMFWPFNHFSKSRSGSDRTIDSIYGTIVARAREPRFYEQYGVPDTVDGRFDLLLLHLWMALRRLGPHGLGSPLSQALFDCFCSDMDANLREMGIGDLTVPKRMQKFGEAFYGRAGAYDAALEKGHDALAQTIRKNVLNGTGSQQADQLAAYAEAVLADLARYDEQAFRSGAWGFVPLDAPVRPASLSGEVT
jgi:cytochrome b pre-mRNA-processing protein 3